MPIQPPKKTISDYEDAFFAANGVPCPLITYSHGWFRFGVATGRNLREIDMLRRTDVLRRRAEAINARGD